MSTRLIRGALYFFAVSAVLGALLALAGPAAPIRFLGLAALAFAALGCTVQALALRAFAPDEYAALRERAFSGFKADPAAPVALGRRAVLGLRR